MSELPYSEVVERFAASGAEIINRDRTTHYAHIGALSKRALEPGYIPIDRPPRIVTVSYYPNDTELDTEASKAARASFLMWAITGSVEAYEASYRDWLAALPSFPFHRDFVRPAFDALDVGDAEFAWLPLVKGPLPARSTVHEDDVFTDRMLLWDQLALLQPSIILAQGMAVADVVKPMCEDKFPHTLVVQKIGRFGSTATRKAEDGRVVRELADALGG